MSQFPIIDFYAYIRFGIIAAGLSAARISPEINKSFEVEIIIKLGV